MTSTAPRSSLTVKELAVEYNTPEGGVRRVVDNVSFAVPSGGRLALVGPSGCGKTSILRALAGLIDIVKGEILYGKHSPTEARSSGSFGLVPQHNALLPWRTAEKNIALPLQLIGIPLEQINQRVFELLRFFRLEDFSDYYPRQLSGGMQSRIAIARALSRSPSILLLDECFGDLDELSRERLNVELSPIWHEIGTTIIFISHSVREAVFLADDIIVLSEQPARIVGQVTVHAEQPRGRDFEGDLAFIEASRKVRMYLEM